MFNSHPLYLYMSKHQRTLAKSEYKNRTNGVLKTRAQTCQMKTATLVATAVATILHLY
jgi:hypothetical protein